MRCSFGVMAKCFFLLALVVHISAQQLPPPPPQQQVAILRQINHVNDDGSYTYGYEAADGSFKIETRDVLGTVRGMFGFVDESGRQRRVSYTAGNTTGFQTTRQPGAEDGGNGDAGVTVTPIRVHHPAAPPHLIIRNIRPFLAGPSGGRDSVAKLIQHLGIIRSKQAEPGRAESTEEAPITTTTIKSSTTSTEATQENGKGDEVTTRRPSVVQRILRTRPRNNASSRKDESLPVSLRAPLATPVGQVQSSKEGEEKKDGSGTVDFRQRQPLVALKVSEDGGVPRFVVLPSRILRWRPSAEAERRKGQDERNAFHPESPVRSRLVEIPIQHDNPQYHIRQLSKENLAESQPTLRIFTQNGAPNINYQDQQYLLQKNVYAFVPTTPRPRLIQPQPINPVSSQAPLHTIPEILPTMFQQLYDTRGSPNEAARLVLQNGNVAEKMPPPTFPQQQQQQMIFQQRPLYDAHNRRYDPYYQRSNTFLPNIPVNPYYRRQDLLDLLLSYLQIQPKVPENRNPYSYPLPYDANVSILPRQEFPPAGSQYQPSQLFTPYQPQYDQYQDIYRQVPTDTNNLDLRRLIDLRALLRPPVRQQIDLPRPLAPPILYGNGYDVQYVKNKGNGYPEDLYIDPQIGRVNQQQGIVIRPTPLQFQPLFLGSTTRSVIPPQQQDFSTLPTGPNSSQSKLVTTVATVTTTEVPTTPENQGLPYGFTKKFRSVQIITPEANESSVKESKTDS